MALYWETLEQVKNSIILDYLGSDLNRSFHEENEVTFPEVVALKHLGKKLKE